MADVVKSLGVTEVTCYRRLQKFGGTLVAQAWSMKQVAQAASVYGTLLPSLPCAFPLLHQKRVPSGVCGTAALGGLADGGRPDTEPAPQGHARIPGALDREVGNALAGARNAGTPAPLLEGG
jgi:hypothetical protein